MILNMYLFIVVHVLEGLSAKIKNLKYTANTFTSWNSENKNNRIYGISGGEGQSKGDNNGHAPSPLSYNL